MVIDINDLLSDAARSGPPLFFPEPEVPISFNFDQGLAAPESFPDKDMTRLTQKVFDRDGSGVLDYFDPDTGYEELVFGYKGLRDELAARYLKRDGRDLGDRGFILTSGSVQAISLAANAFINPGDVVVVESASFPYAMRYMEVAGAEILTVPVDKDGMNVDVLVELISQIQAEGKKLKMVYTIATFQLPTGAVMSLDRRKQLVALAKEHQFIVLEDNVYGELRFEGEPVPTLLSLDDSGLVIQADAFSKTIAPGLRLGWMAGESDAIAALGAVRQDLGVSQWICRLMTEYLREGLFDPHLAKVTVLYKSKRDAAMAAINQSCGDYVSYTAPQGSFYLWLEIDERVDWERAAQMAAEAGVFFRPGEKFMDVSDNRQFVRLAYSHVKEPVITAGLTELGNILKQCARQT
jgi:2-aminoadipate transaminase